MTATANPLKMNRSAQEKLQPALYYKLKIGTKIPAGTLAMRVSGNDYVEPYVGNTSGAILMGVAEQTYDNTTGVAVLTYPNDKPMVFDRGCFDQFLSDGTITFDDVGTLVGVKDNQTIGHTVAAHDCTVELLAIDRRDRSGALVYTVRVAHSGPA
jgi:hypothetical protein